MTTYPLRGAPAPAKPHDCGCGGTCRCDSRCCDLECLVRPRFFCGQLLTDADLTATVEWARSRFGLARYRDGWGVACGLDVTCTLEHADHSGGAGTHAHSTVYVHPGYAIDCCGNDLVVCDPIAVDLHEVCRPLDDPCGELPKKPREDTTESRPRRGDGQEDQCWASLSDQLVAVNLTLRYQEDLAQGQRAMFRSGCSDVGPCEHARVLERPCVHAELVPVEACWKDADAERWDRDFELRRKRVHDELLEAIKGDDPESVLRYLRRHPPHRFCFIEEYVCCLLDQPKGRPGGWQSRVLLWLYLDWLLQTLECQCGSCRPDSGVPLARVLLRRVEVRGGYECRVVLVDTGVPYRRRLHKDECRPVPIGAVDLAPYLWQPVDHAIGHLRKLGVKILDAARPLEATEDTVVARGRLWVGVEENVQVVAIKDLLECDRVAAFVVPSVR